MKKTIALLLLAGLSASLHAEQDYEIRVERAAKPGDRFKVVARGRKSQEMQFSPATAELKDTKDDFSIEYTAIRTVTAVDESGRPIKVSDTIQKLSVIRGGNHAELAQPGSTLVAFVIGKKKMFEIDGRRVDDPTEKALEVVIDISTGGPRDDEIFGTKTKRKIGENWDMNTALAARDAANRFNLDIRNLVGSSTLQSVTHEPAGDVLRIICHFKGDAQPALPFAVSFARCPFEASWSAKVPVDPSLARMESSMALSLRIEGTGRGPNAMGINIKAALTQSAICQATPLKD